MPETVLGDAMMRDSVGTVPVPDFQDTAWTPPPPLADARVSVVTTAAIYPQGGDDTARVRGGRTKLGRLLRR